MMRFPEYFGAQPLDLHLVGLFGVAVFFGISGFIVALVSVDAGLKPRLSMKEYAWRRFVRIVPFLWICTIGYNIFTWLGNGVIEWQAALRALVVWPVGELKPSVTWSLRHELQFYAVFAICLLGKRQMLPLLIAWFLLPLPVVILLGYQDIGPATDYPVLRELANVVLMGSQSGANLQFGVGFLLGWLYLNGSPLVRWPRPPGPWAVVAAMTAGTFIFIAMRQADGLGMMLLSTVLAAFITWVAVLACREQPWLSPLGLLLGNASFSIYLVHNAVLLVMLELAARLHTGISAAAYLPICVVAATIGGIIVHLLVEAPLIAFLTRKGRAAARASSSAATQAT